MEEAELGEGRTNGTVEKMHAKINVSNRRLKNTDLDVVVLDMTLLKYARCAN
jgi:hypothetical protein